MICLGIESTAHTFGVGIVDGKGKVLANVKRAFTTKKGGMVPFQVAEHHTDVCDAVVKEALEKAGIGIKDIELISFSQGPGIGQCLRVGSFMTRVLSLKLKKPLVGVNHAVAHQEIGKLLTKAKDPVLLYASGANTQVIAYEAGKYRVFGETLDQGVGNFLDSFARFAGLGFPGGPKIYELSLKGKNFIELPYTVKGMDVSFGGLLTNVKHKFNSGRYKLEDLCFSIQETVFAMLAEISERAMAHTGKKELVLGGGVACNKRLQEMCSIMCKERGAKFFCPENEFLVDNGGMIAYTGELMWKKDKKIAQDYKKIDIKPRQRTDEVDVV